MEDELTQLSFLEKKIVQGSFCQKRKHLNYHISVLENQTSLPIFQQKAGQESNELHNSKHK